MYSVETKREFFRRVERFAPEIFVEERSMAMYSASITIADSSLQEKTLERMIALNVSLNALYEVILQSYLFLGFPRMLQAAEVFHGIIDRGRSLRSAPEITVDDFQSWNERGAVLCRRVYAGKFDSLRRKVTHMAPEIFQWMILEGYGKVLSRPGLDIVSREMAVMACLMIEGRLPQLRSHIEGAVNVGADLDLIEAVVSDIGPIFREGHRAASEFVAQMRAQL